ncbi:MAG: hypothetical protein KDJ47_13060 [Hyphomicrobiaceae bacterium]|nr:hypothetical protein [Hyphomicrobiaceae bacterium]
MTGLGEQSDKRPDVVRAPAGVGTALAVVVGLILAGGLYLIAVRGDALFVDLAALSGLLFCF